MRVVKSGDSETYRVHTYFTDTYLPHVSSSAELSRTAVENSGTMQAYTASIWRGEYDRYDEQGNFIGTQQYYDEYTDNPQLKFDFGLSFSSSQFRIQSQYTKIPNTNDWDGDDYVVTDFQTSYVNSFTPLFYPHRTAGGNVILLLHAGADLQQFGRVTIETPIAYENSIFEGFHVFDVGKLSDSPTFTLGNETAFPSFYPVSETHSKHTIGAAFFYYFWVDYFWVDYGAENGFLFKAKKKL